MRPTIAAYTENYVATGWGMYAEVRKALTELQTFEDLVQPAAAGGMPGRVADGTVGLWHSQAFDIWGQWTPPLGNENGPVMTAQHHNTWVAAKRALWVMLQHAELPVDVVVEDDIGASATHAHLLRRLCAVVCTFSSLPSLTRTSNGPGATLNSYKLLYLADTHVTDAASAALVKWVNAGGNLVATAGAVTRYAPWGTLQPLG